MSGIGDIAGTLGAIAPSALAGYGRGRVRGMQYANQQAYQQQQLQGLQQYREQLIEMQREANRVKEHLAEHEADQKELARLSDIILKDPHALQERKQLQPTMLQWAGLYQKVHPGEPLPSFFGEQFKPGGPEEAPLPQPLQAAGVTPQGMPALSAGTQMKPPRFTGIPEIPLDEKDQAAIENYRSLGTRRQYQNEWTDEQIIQLRVFQDPKLMKLYSEIALLDTREGDIPKARAQAQTKIGLLADALGVNRGRLAEMIRNNQFNNDLGYDNYLLGYDRYALSNWKAQQEEAKAKSQVPQAVWKSLEPLFRGYFQTDMDGDPLPPAQREPYRRGIIALYQQNKLDPRPFLRKGEPGYDPAFALSLEQARQLQADADALAHPEEADDTAGTAAPGTAGAATLSGAPAPGATGTLPPAGVRAPGGPGPPGRRTKRPAIGAGEVPHPQEMRQRYPTYPGSFGEGDPGPQASSGFYTPAGGTPGFSGFSGSSGAPRLPDATGAWDTDPAEVERVGKEQRWQMAYLPSQPGFSQPPPAPKGERVTGGELTTVNNWIQDGSFARRIRSPKAHPKDRVRLLRAYWQLRGRPYRGP